MSPMHSSRRHPIPTRLVTSPSAASFFLGVALCACSAGLVSDDAGPASTTLPDAGIILGSGGNTTTPGVLGSGSCDGTQFTCEIPKCANEDVATTISGKVWDPAGKNPLNGAVVYVPAKPDEIAAISPGLTTTNCETCVKPSGGPIAGTVTGPDGSFVITKAPVGTKVPLVVQIGKWRRMTFVEVKNKCADNPITDKNLTRLPKNQSDGLKASIPRIAIVVGDADRLQCLFTRMGIDMQEFTNPTGTGALHLYNLPSSLNDSSSYVGKFDSSVNSGAAFPIAANDLWNNLNNMAKYDIILLACGGKQSATDPLKTTPNPISDNAKNNMRNYLAYGGRVFAEHFHWAWIKSYPAAGTKTTDPSYPAPLGVDIASWIPYATDNKNASTPALVETSFPKGQDFAKWLLVVGASTSLGTITFDPSDDTTKPSAKDELTPGPSGRRWIYQPADANAPTGAAANTHYLSFNVSSSAEVIDRLDTTNTNICGRFVYTGLHVAAAASSAHPPDSKTTFPSQCQAGDLSSYEKAIEFMMFDLSSCLTLDTTTTKKTIIF